MSGMTEKSVLLNPFNLRGLQLKNRVVMSPMTRARAGQERMPNALMAEQAVWYSFDKIGYIDFPRHSSLKIRRLGKN